jgi:mono/diheme cytochrome c family protein
MKQIILAGLALLAVTAARADEGPPPESTKHANLAGYSHFRQQDGEGLYYNVCAACHMSNAMGGSGALTVPALAKNDKLAVSAYPVMMVMNGHGGMPSFRDQMSDAQVAAVVGYVRSHFGNAYADPVPVDEVKQVREAK